MDEFIDLIQTSGLEDSLLKTGQNLTVFVPSNDAIEDFRHDMEEVYFILLSLQLLALMLFLSLIL